LFHQSISFHSCIVARLNEVGDMLFGIVIFIELIEFGKLIAIERSKDFNPLHIRL